MKPTVTIRKALADPRLLGTALPGDSWMAWRTLLIAAVGEELVDEAEREVFRKLTGRQCEPRQLVREIIAVIGRRAGKSRAMAILSVYLAALCSYDDVLAPGERGILLVISLSQDVAGIVLGYAWAALEGSPILRQLIKATTQDTIELTNGISIEVRPCGFKRLRGPTLVGCLVDEAAFFFTETSYSNPDIEIVNAVKPALLTTNGLLALVSSPYSKRGVLYDRWRQYFGREDSDILVVHGGTRDLNPSISAAEIERELEADPVRNRAEYLAEFRDDVSGFTTMDVISQCIGGYYEQLPASETKYVAFTDPAGGQGPDSMSLAVAHRTKDDLVEVDAIREARPYFSPQAVVDEFAAVLKSYRITKLIGDHYGGEFVKEPFRKHGISYEVSKAPKSDLYRDLLPVLNSGRVVLPKNERLIAQILGLERRVGRSGKDSIDHGPNGHDDLVNCLAGVVAAARKPTYDPVAVSQGIIDLYEQWLPQLQLERGLRRMTYIG